MKYEIDGAFDYHGLNNMPKKDAEMVKKTFTDRSSSRVDVRVALWMIWWYSDNRDGLYKDLAGEYYDVIYHPNLPNHPRTEIANLANGEYAGDLKNDVEVSNGSVNAECFICERNSDTFTELQMDEHHISYKPEQTVFLCSYCHGSTHHKDNFFDELDPDRSREWLNYEFKRAESDTPVQVSFDAYNSG